MTPMLYAAAGLVALSLLQIALLVRLARSARVAARADERVSQLTSALALLTDTAEEGFVNVAAELERLGARPLPSGSSRRATTRRIVAAVNKGRSVEDIARAESLSESEVVLHLGLDQTPADTAPERTEAPAAPATPGVLEELESWLHVVGQGKRGRGKRHAAVRA